MASFLLMVHSAPLFICFGIAVQIVVRQVERFERLEQEALVVVIANPTSLLWEEPGKEAWIDHELFDVKGVEKMPDGNIKLTGIFDHKEKSLRNAARQSGGNDSDMGKLSRTLQHLISLGTESYSLAISPVSGLITLVPHPDEFILSIVQEVPNPPPSFA